MAQGDNKQGEGDAGRRLLVEDKKSTEGKIGGTIHIHEGVVETIAGLAGRQIQGIHSIGRRRVPFIGRGPTAGVSAEVGDLEAALDLEVVIEYGCNITDVVGELRSKIAEQVRLMAGRDVVEINLDVVGVHMPEADEQKPKGDSTPRVR